MVVPLKRAPMIGELSEKTHSLDQAFEPVLCSDDGLDDRSHRDMHEGCLGWRSDWSDYRIQ